MTIKTYKQEFKGYWRYKNRGGVPKTSGVYCVYEGTYNSNNDTVSLGRLLYIGQAKNMNERLENHEKLSAWKKYLKSGEEIIFSCTELETSDLDRFEAAMIYEHKPPVNEEYVNNFPYDSTTVYTSGRNALLKEHFTVYKTSSLVHY